jgi:hypothetical protein
VPKRSTGNAAFKAQLRRHLKADKVPPHCRIEMCATSKPQAEDGDAAFALRAAGGQDGWQAAILLRQIEFINFNHQACSYRLRRDYGDLHGDSGKELRRSFS